MNIQEQIDEILGFFKEDCGYCAITGTIFKDDIDTKIFKFQEVKDEEVSFNHTYGVSHSMGNMDDYYSGITLIPVGNDVYIKCEWSS